MGLKELNAVLHFSVSMLIVSICLSDFNTAKNDFFFLPGYTEPWHYETRGKSSFWDKC